MNKSSQSIDELKRYIEVMDSNLHPLITKARGRQLDRFFYGKGPLAHKTIYWGCKSVDWLPDRVLPQHTVKNLSDLDTLLPKNIILSEKAWHMAVTWPISWAFAGEAYKLVCSGGQNRFKNNRPTALEMFTGAGSLLSGIINAGFKVLATIDNNALIMDMARHNFNVFQIKSDFHWILGNAMEYISKLDKNSQKIDVVFADPEWKKKRLHDIKTNLTPFKLQDMSPNGETVVETALKIANHVALKVPMNLLKDDLKKFAMKLHVKLYILDINQPISNERIVGERMAFFSSNSSNQYSYAYERIGVNQDLILGGK
jgi:16S rRNA G966 N2-methylase RsmD